MWKFLFRFHTKALSSVSLQIKCDFYGGTEQEFSAMKNIDEQVSSLLRLLCLLCKQAQFVIEIIVFSIRISP
jgi:hypothetical protein